jgi:hypothetical protein
MDEIEIRFTILDLRFDFFQKKHITTMKNTLFLLFFSTTLFAQKNMIRMGAGSAFFGSGDLRGTHLRVEYQRELKKYLSLGVDFSISNASKYSSYMVLTTEVKNFSQNSANKLNTNIYLNLLNTEHHLVQFGSGISFRFGSEYFRYGHSSVGMNSQILQDSGEFSEKSELGYLINVGYTYKINQKWNLHLIGSHQRYLNNADTIFGGGFGFSF